MKIEFLPMEEKVDVVAKETLKQECIYTAEDGKLVDVDFCLYYSFLLD